MKMALSTVEVVGTAVFSERPAELAAFYERVLGISLEHRQHRDGREHWITNIGAVHFEIKATRRDDGSPTPDAVATGGSHSNIELSFRVDDAVATFDLAIECGGRVHQPLVEYRWGAFGVVLDPDGNRLGVYGAPSNPDPGA
jgi:predicted enzyme related to lactoylglutathione lyase